MKYILLVLSVVGLNLPAASQITNPSFESWQPDGTKWRLQGWTHLQKGNSAASLNGTSREQTNQHGIYSLKLSRWYDYTWDKVTQHTSISYKPSTLTGYYNFANTDLIGDRDHDTAYVYIAITRWNPSLNQTDTLGSGQVELAASSGFRFFSCPITYSNTADADSMFIEISPSKFDGTPSYCSTPGYCSFLLVDNLQLKDTTVAVQDFLPYPNPTRNKVLINLPQSTSGKLQLFNATGQMLSEKTAVAGVNEINLTIASTGIYFLLYTNRTGTIRAFRILKN